MKGYYQPTTTTGDDDDLWFPLKGTALRKITLQTYGSRILIGIYYYIYYADIKKSCNWIQIYATVYIQTNNVYMQ